VLIATHAAPDRVRTSVLHKLGLMIAALERVPPRDCRTCGQRFGFSAAEIEFYRKRSLPLATHCRHCRKARRQQPSEREYDRADGGTTVADGAHQSKASGETTAMSRSGNGLQQP
jgi:hypothetical protein